MTVHTFLIGSILTGVSTWAIWGLIVSFLDPVQAGWIGFLLFFLALFLAVASTAGLIGYVARRIASPDQLASHAVRPAIRQGIMLGLFLDILLATQLIRLYRWWLAVIIIIFFLAIEFMFLSYDRSSKRRSRPVKK